MLFFSGCSALIFQVAWMRELRLVFGATTAAVAAVLAVFMGGLGLGSAVLGRRADRVANPLWLYGVLETAVAMTVAVSPLLVMLAAACYFALGGQGAMGLAGASVARLLLAIVVMGVPTFLMGGTMPAAVRSVTATGDTRRRALAVLYGVNTLGAVCGAYFATFFALEFLGTRATLWFGCALNLLVGVLAVKRSESAPEVKVDALKVDEVKHAGEEITGGSRALSRSDGLLGPSHPEPEISANLVYATAAVLGFTFFTLELVWYRMLAPILGGTTFTFGMILCVALFGIGVGSAAYHFVFRWVWPSWSVLAVTCAAEAVLAAFPLALGDRLALFAGRWFVESRTFFQLEMGWILVMSVVVLPVALVSGLQFPLLVALLGRGRMAVSRQLGMTYAWNTVGAITGSLVGGFGALPLLTAPGAWRAVAILLVGLSIVLLLRSWRSAGRSAAIVAALLLVAVFCVAQEGPTAVWRHSSIGAGRALVPPANDLNGTQFWINEQRRKLLWEAEGIESSIGITATDGISFVVNGKNDGNATGDVGTQIGMAIIGATLHPDPKTGLVIGLGTGESAGWLASLRDMERVDVLELEPAIDEMARRSAILNRDALNHPKVRRIYNDGREHVLTTTEKYDVVLSEPSNPYRAGVSSLYTQEFYRAVRARMTPDGVFVQWLQAYEVDPYTVNSVLATARSVFDYVELWQTLPGDLQLVCSQAAIKYSEAELRARVAEPVMQEALRLAWSVDGLEGFLSRFAANQAFVNRVVSPGMYPANTDDRNFLEYGFAKTVGLITGFSGASVRDAAVEFGEHRPPLVGDTIDWDLVEQRRVEFNWQNGGNLAAHKTYTPIQRALIEGYNEFYNQKFPEALAKWAAVPEGKLSDIDRLVQSAAHAEVGDAKCLELIAPVAAEYPAEAAAVRATYYWSQKDATRATEQVMLLFDSMASNPWAISDLVRLTFKQASTIVGQDPAAERQLFEKLSKPFAAERFEHQRPLLRLLIAEKLGQAEVIEVLEEFEPYPVWLEDSLQLRAETYKAAKHPLADEAHRDLETFRKNAK